MKNKKVYVNKDILKFALQILAIALAGLVGGSAFKTFFEAVGIIPTGISGFSLIIHNLFLNGNINIPTSVFYLIFNSLIFLLALKFLVGNFCYFLE